MSDNNEKTVEFRRVSDGNTAPSADNSKKKPRMPLNAFKHNEKYHPEVLDEAIENYDKEMETYLKEIGREKEVNWSTATSSVYKFVYFPKVYPTIKEQGFHNDK